MPNKPTYDPVLISIIRQVAPVDFANSIIHGTPTPDPFESAWNDYHTIIEHKSDGNEHWARFKYPTIPADVHEWCRDVGIRYETFSKDLVEDWHGKIAFDDAEALDMFLVRWR